MSKYLTVLSAVMILIVTTAASPTVAQNLVVNPDFDIDTSGWSGPAAWDTLDVDGSTTSGSATYLITSVGASGAAFALQCVVLDPMIDGYDFSAWTYVASGQTATGFARADLWWYTDTLCDSFLSSAVFSNSSLFDVWEPSGGSAFTPPTALSVRVTAINQSFGDGDFQVYVDGFSLEPNLSMIFGDSFESGTLDAWSTYVSGPG